VASWAGEVKEEGDGDLKEIKINSKCRFDREIKRSLSPRGKERDFQL
jgi:hypothetical protein